MKMSKCILLSVKPQYVAKILNGEKTIEIRKHAIPVGTKVYIYCTKDKSKELLKMKGNRYVICNEVKWWEEENPNDIYDKLNGKVVASFVVSECEAIGYDEVCGHYATWELGENELLSKYCLSQKEMQNYLGVGKKCYIPNSFSKLAGFAWHISQLKIFDRPKELREFKGRSKVYYNEQMKKDNEIHRRSIYLYLPLTKAPQSYCYVEELDS